jgi:aspartate/methionine/tyrosine aminotransferase
MFNPYDSKLRPNGGICLAIAENKLLANMLLERVRAFNGYTHEVLNYTMPTGLPSTRAALAQFMSRRLFAGAAVAADNLVVGAGCTSLLTELSLLLFEANDAVLIPAPYYPTFDADFKNVGGVITVPVTRPTAGSSRGASSNRSNTTNNTNTNSKSSSGSDDDDLSELLLDNMSEAAFEEAYARAVKAGHPPKALLLTNPGNPMGNVCTRKQLKAAVSWTMYRGLHLVVDEIYALSLYDEKEPFVSIAEVLGNQLGDHVHVLWGVSKDLGASGLRLGVLYSHNKELLAAMGGVNMAAQVSNQVQQTVADVLSDTVFMDAYLVENRRVLKLSYDTLHAALEPLGIKIVQPSGASIFVFADFRSLLTDNTFAAERRLFTALADRGVVLTPGESCHCPVPGFFRICFAWVPLTTLEEALRRIKLMVQRKDNTCLLS